MPARLEALHDHGVDSGGDGSLGFGGRTDLDQYLLVVTVGSVDVGGGVAPEQHDRRHVQLADGRDQVAEEDVVAWVGLGDDHVHAEGRAGEGAGLGDAGGDELDGGRAAAQDTKAAGVGDGCGQLGACGPADAGVQDGVAHIQQVAEGGVQAGSHASIIGAHRPSAGSRAG